MIEIPVSKIQTNSGQISGLPKNPRTIRDKRFAALKKSIEDFPEMLSLREIVVFPFADKFIAIGGNMRLMACKDLGYKKVPCKILPADFPVEKLREFTAKDNIGFGEDDLDLLANEWNLDDLVGYGMDLPKDFLLIGDPEPETQSETTNSQIIVCPNCSHNFSLLKEK